MRFDGKTALITGGSRGIGRAIAARFAALGADVAFNYLRNRAAAADARAEIESLGARCLAVRAHLGDEGKIAALFDAVEAEYGKLDILVNNAASGVQRPAAELTAKHWDWTMNVNARAAWLCAVAASKLMPDGGSVVNITSEGSRRVLPYYFSVGVSKAALEAATRYLAVELAPMGISVNAVSGGYVDTGALDHFPTKDDMLAAGENTPAGGMVTAEDIAAAATFLCSPEARMIRGQVIVVDGGATLVAG